MVLFAKVVHSTLALLPFFVFYRKTFRTILAEWNYFTVTSDCKTEKHNGVT